jgi:hypothetical protein
MGEREPVKETIGKGEIFFLCHSGTEKIFSGYGLTVEPGRKDYLVGLLIIDRPKPADPEWLKEIEVIFGEYQLVAMTASGERGIACTFSRASVTSVLSTTLVSISKSSPS